MTSVELREKRAALVPQIRALADKQAEWSAEDQANWDALNKDYDQLARQIEIAERTERLENDQEKRAAAVTPGREDRSCRPDAEPPAGVPTEEDRAVALQAWCRVQAGLDITDRQRETARRCGVNPSGRELDISLRSNYADVRREARGTGPLTTQTVGTGGYTIPKGFVANLEMALLQFGGVRQVANVFRTESGNDLSWPTANDTGNSGELLTENTETAYLDATFGVVTFYAYKFGSKLVKVPSELLQDSAFDIAAVLGQMMGERIGRIEASYFTTGTGSSQPHGIVTASTAGKTTASASAITAEEILDLVHSVDPAYRMQGCGFMFHDNILLALRKLKDGEGRYLWQAGMVAGEPDTLWGYPIYINQSMASSITNNAKTMLFGQLNKFAVRDVQSIRIRRLVERFAEYDQEGFVAFTRTDSRLLDAGTHPIKHLLQHS